VKQGRPQKAQVHAKTQPQVPWCIISQPTRKGDSISFLDNSILSILFLLLNFHRFTRNPVN
jgi:hypothetical protein